MWPSLERECGSLVQGPSGISLARYHLSSLPLLLPFASSPLLKSTLDVASIHDSGTTTGQMLHKHDQDAGKTINEHRALCKRRCAQGFRCLPLKQLQSAPPKLPTGLNSTVSAMKQS